MQSDNSSFRTFLNKFSPKQKWTKLVLKTLSRGKKIEEDQSVKTGGTYRIGLVISKLEDAFVVTSRTVHDGTEKINSIAVYTDSFVFVQGKVHMFGFGFENDLTGSYHNQLFDEFTKLDTLEWDLID
jgi:hypothetical protein